MERIGIKIATDSKQRNCTRENQQSEKLEYNFCHTTGNFFSDCRFKLNQNRVGQYQKYNQRNSYFLNRKWPVLRNINLYLSKTDAVPSITVSYKKIKS